MHFFSTRGERREILEISFSTFLEISCFHAVNIWARLRVVSNFGDGDCGAGEIHTRARKFEETRREGSAEN